MKFITKILLVALITYIATNVFSFHNVEAQFISNHSIVNEEINHWQVSKLKGKVKNIRANSYLMKLDKDEWVKDEIRSTVESFFNNQGYLTSKYSKPVSADTAFFNENFYNETGELREAYTKFGSQKVQRDYYANWLKIKHLIFEENNLLKNSIYFEYDSKNRLISEVTYLHQNEDSTTTKKREYFYKDSMLNKILSYKKTYKYQEAKSPEVITVDMQFLMDQAEFVLSSSMSFEGGQIKESSKFRNNKLWENTHYVYGPQGKLVKIYIVHFDTSKYKNKNRKSRDALYQIINYEYNEQGLLVEEVEKERKTTKTVYEYNEATLLTKKTVWKEELMYMNIDYAYDKKGNISTSLKSIYKDGILDRVLLNEKIIEYFSE